MAFTELVFIFLTFISPLVTEQEIEFLQIALAPAVFAKACNDHKMPESWTGNLILRVYCGNAVIFPAGSYLKSISPIINLLYNCL